MLRPTRPTLRALLSAAALLAFPALPLQGQQATSDGPGFQAALLGGQTGMGSPVHRFGGLHLGLGWERWGGAVQAHVGTGNGFRSTYLTAGPTFRIPLHPRAELQAMIGGAYYGESLDVGNRSGSVLGPAGALLFRIPTGPVHVVVGATGWYAEYTDEIAVNPVPAEGLRLVLGVGR